jgi:geranylgeranyl diphosphate synthase, type I
LSGNDASTTSTRNATSVHQRLAPYQQRVEKELRARLESDRLPAPVKPAPLVRPNGAEDDLSSVMDPIRHVVDAGGKRLRPVLCLLAAEATGGDAQQALAVATGIEYLHTFTLVHDDVMDDDLLRRGRPTVHALWGAPVAITAGDGLYALAMATILDTSTGADPAVLAKIAAKAAQVSFALCAGQTQDLLFESRSSVSPEEYHAMINEKTAVLMGLSMEAGALVAGANDDDVRDLHEYGLQLGLAFQVKDDLLDLIGSEEEIGKPTDSDLRAGKKTYPIVHALHHLDEDRQRRLEELLAAPEKRTTPQMVQEMRGLLEHADSLQESAQHAAQLGEKARVALKRFRERHDPTGETLDILEQIIDHVIKRDR